MAFQTVLLAAAVVAYLVVKYLNQTDIPKIKNLPEIPGVPLFGNLLQLGNSHARSCQKLAAKYGPVFQTRLGNRRFIYVNTFEAVKDLWVGHHQALISRPTTWTFHSVVSTSQGPTLATSPWNESTKRVRKAASTAINRKSVQTYLPSIDLECTIGIKEILDASKSGDVDPIGYFQRFSLNMSLRVNYGFRLKGAVNDEKIREVVDVERELGTLRGVAHCWQDYIPIMRLWPSYRKHASSLRQRRDDYLLEFYEELVRRIAEGTDVPSITGSVIKDPEAKLSENELKTVSLTMVAAGLDTLPSNINMTIAYLSCPHGQEIQKRAYEELMRTYPDGDGWHACLENETCEYLIALVKETLRFWSTINLSITRQSVKDIEYKGVTFPAGTPFVMNNYAANHDWSQFKDPDTYNPERYLGVPNVGIQQMSYGAGARMCEGAHLANRELYVIFARLILGFHIRETSDIQSRPNLDPIDCNSLMTGMVTQPKPFKVKFVPRDEYQLQKWITESKDRTVAFDI
ncbi:uncharacterized protein Z520_10057 [Fonsecaea multimorphosa CBS 102226]|uniref:Phenylacetate 2-hydroxylase n=1 Tax=Fonsecaea multimorphosa CBS 102226 TaxID=1442371 RepID=A0A0D2JM03_9EURO|nr:uncharacterized protein Z520_10057 [Fonsecaea multimorphosa CBS 102226]KIX94347.1 hypothetical protein Z520_10057 [Fonsecaea multimorphosa CBS 102226]OAL19679.1 hypothetical protein AYO22_09551 [Fonsecaea multimorphosa]